MKNNLAKIENKLKELTLSGREKSKAQLIEIIGKIPNQYANLIEDASVYKRIPKEYLLSAIFFSVSTSMGLTFYIDAIGYRNYGNLYFTIVGSRGDTKSEALKLATKPLKLTDDKTYDNFTAESKSFNSEIDEEPIRKQILLQNSTIESVHKTHKDNPNSVGVYVDEIYTLISKMGNPNSRDGVEWRTFLLQGYTNDYVDVGRVSTKSFRIKETYPTMLGGIQHEFVLKIFANGNLESGFVDRLLFTPKLSNNTNLVKGEISGNVLDNYNRSIKNILEYKQTSEMPDEKIKNFRIELTEKAEERIFNYTQELIDRKEQAGKIIKEYIAKMQISIHKLSLVLYMMYISEEMNYTKKLDTDIVELAILINEYFLNNFKIILEENYTNAKNEVILDDVIEVAIKNDALQTSIIDVFGISKSMTSKHFAKVRKKLETRNHKKETS